MLWVVIVSFVLAFILSFGLGANDVSNAFATSIGAKVISLKYAFLIASIAELTGSVTLGGLVTDNIRLYTLEKGVLSNQEVMIGMMCSLLAVAIWLILATWWKLPVSATHAVFSSIIGFALVANSDAINWGKMISMLIAWLIAPMAAGTVSVLCFSLLVYFILKKTNSYQIGLFAIPFIYTITITVNVSVIVYQFLRHNTDENGYWLRLGLALGGVSLVAIVTYFIAYFYIVPWIKKKVMLKFQYSDNIVDDDISKSIPLDKDGVAIKNALSSQETDKLADPTFDDALKDNTEVKTKQSTKIDSPTEQLFAFLQILSAVFTSFAHGSNDVSNSIGPLVGMFNEYMLSLGEPELTPSSYLLYLFLVYGAVGMIIGLYVWGARVIETLGCNLTDMCPSRGFAIELGSALTVLVSSLLGYSVSTTHCKVGSIVAVGFFSHYIIYYLGNVKAPSTASDILLAEKGVLHTSSSENAIEEGTLSKAEPSSLKDCTQSPLPSESVSPSHHTESRLQKASVNWKLCFNIILSWICTIPFSGLLAAGFYALFSRTL